MAGTILLLMACPPLFRTALSWDAFYAPPVFMLILSLSLSNGIGLSRILSFKPIVILGEASFAMYLIHASLLQEFNVTAYKNAPITQALSVWAAAFSTIIACSVGLHYFFERPVRHWLMNRKIF
jgi:peptidoglycan/LPS O-acetylase OafA/YrhL